MPEITSTLAANAHWSEFENEIAKVIVTREHYTYVMSLAEELIRAAYNDDIMPCINASDHQFSGSTYSDCVKCGEPEH